MKFVVLVGASGSGKTTIANAIERRYTDEVRVFYFDQMGVPSSDRMIVEYGSAEAWQRAKTFEWVAKLAPMCDGERGVLFEGQTRLSFLDEAAEAAGGVGYLPILVDCNDETRVRRLSRDRRQPELANEDTMRWAEYLRCSAKEYACEILDTSRNSPDECVAYVIAQLRREKNSR